MYTVALIGGDGAGKTTIADQLRDSFPLPLKYLYMGINIESSNVALPTSRIIEKLKKQKNVSPTGDAPPSTSLHNRPQKRKPAGKVWATIRLCNRIAEELYRQVLSWNYRRKGFIVLYDRYFTFDFASFEPAEVYRQRPWDDRIHRWFLANHYPHPDMTIFLYAPPEVLYARKGEASIEYLDNLQQTYLKQGERSPNFIVVDATQPLEKVYDDVCNHLFRFYEERSGKPVAEQTRRESGKFVA
ncbi:MAG: hypothetical protein KDG51_19190 [Calditrichaeota bacterium]|nr:hypothetical protein [Calditrichota bacterium]